MAKIANPYRCGECGWTSLRWVGRCGECQAWGSVSQGPATALKVDSPTTPAVPIAEVALSTARATPTGIAELDRVLGRGLTPGAVILLAGEPGVGKSTLLLDVAKRAALAGRGVAAGGGGDQLYLATENQLPSVLGQIEQVRPELLIIDSVQTIEVPGAEGTLGGVAQVKAVTSAVVQVAKQRGLPVLLVGHVTKDGNLAGPRTLEHLVDVVLSFDGDPHSGFRMLRATKNRFGPAEEVGCFELVETGIREVPDPSGLFTSNHYEPTPGTCLSIALAGRRPLLTEVQALVLPTAAPTPRRVTHGVEAGRIAMLLAVLQRRSGLRLHHKEVYVATVGGARIAEPAGDLAAAIAIASAAADRAFSLPVVALGEVGLSGELRRIAGLERRLAEAGRLGIEVALVPSGSSVQGCGVRVIEVPNLSSALEALRLLPQAKPGEAPRRPKLTVLQGGSRAPVA